RTSRPLRSPPAASNNSETVKFKLVAVTNGPYHQRNDALATASKKGKDIPVVESIISLDLEPSSQPAYQPVPREGLRADTSVAVVKAAAV
ncbi:hypothetical protein FRC07_013380, partial [Ceratobasidium sp. 392]